MATPIFSETMSDFMRTRNQVGRGYFAKTPAEKRETDMYYSTILKESLKTIDPTQSKRGKGRRR